jgi:hypothetical protein
METPGRVILAAGRALVCGTKFAAGRREARRADVEGAGPTATTTAEGAWE